MDDDLLTAIRDFLAEHPMARTSFGRAAVGNPVLLDRLEAGGDVTTRTAKRIRDFMDGYGAG